jgi:hypothetical protein
MSNPTKVCRECGEEKTIDCFSTQGKNRRQAKCKPCRARLRRETYKANPEHNIAIVRRYQAKNKEKIRAYQKANHERTLELQRNRRRDGETYKKWVEENRDKVRASARRYSKKARQDPRHRIRDAISKGIARGVLGKKSERTFNALPYTVEELMSHLESLFQAGMTWDNYGLWHIDHIKPHIMFDYQTMDDPEFYECWSLNNLQPLWARDNLSKGSLFEGVRYYKTSKTKS